MTVVGYRVPDSPSILSVSQRVQHEVQSRRGLRIVVDAAERHVLLAVADQPFAMDENHAQALILALQAAVAEVQARAVSL